MAVEDLFIQDVENNEFSDNIAQSDDSDVRRRSTSPIEDLTSQILES
ncbi:4885_t:CDS:2 [Rhizophagus irregularis]|nr:4885_t:CDS:2 [Rhizophagus irregularis]